MLDAALGEPASPALFTSAASVCGVCLKEYSKYKCPRCAMHYCSLGCYRSHSESCTEGFFQEQTQASMRADKPPAEQQLDMLRKLKRLEAGDEDADSSGGSSIGSSGDESDEHGEDAAATEERAARLARLLEQTNIDESELSERERAEFRRLLADGSLGAELQGAPVWWASLPADALEATSRVSGDGCYGWKYASERAEAAGLRVGAPTLPSGLPPLRSLTSREPPAQLLFNLLEVVCSYAYASRIFCGAVADDPE
jgi:hypothetical protein